MRGLREVWRAVGRWLQRSAELKVPSFVIVGLGNPGVKYERTRHNVGFMVVDELAKQVGVRVRVRRFHARIATAEVNGKCILLVKPQTFMNLSGEAVQLIVHHYQLPLDRLLIILDDVNLPLGKLRIRPRGSHGGHRGLRSVIETLRTQNFPRLRIGIGKPPVGQDLVDYVLSPFAPDEEETLQLTIARATDAVFTFIAEGIERAMSAFNA